MSTTAAAAAWHRSSPRSPAALYIWKMARNLPKSAAARLAVIAFCAEIKKTALDKHNYNSRISLNHINYRSSAPHRCFFVSKHFLCRDTPVNKRPHSGNSGGAVIGVIRSRPPFRGQRKPIKQLQYEKDHDRSHRRAI